MTDDLVSKTGPEFDHLKRSFEGLIEYVGTTSLNKSDRKGCLKWIRRIERVIVELSESMDERFDALPRYLQDLRRDLGRQAFTDSERQEVLLRIASIEDSLQTLKAIFWEADLAIIDAHFGYLWTTEKDDWWLIEVADRDGKIGYDIEQISKNMSLIIEDDEWDFYVIERMIEAGNRRVTLDEYAALFPRDLSEDWTPPPPVELSDFLDETESDDTED